MLPHHIGDMQAAGVETVTVTVNAVGPEIQAVISPKMAWQRKRLDGIAAAARLIANQLDGIRAAAERGMTVKVNAVLIPGVNDRRIGKVAERVAEAGARMINIIPLIPQHGFAHLKEPGMMMRQRARAEAARHLRVFTHCQR
jgi:nitrogen fixation protein NifB